MLMRPIVLSVSLVAVSALAAPPASRVEPVKDALHGVEITDNYRWLEGDNSDPQHMGKITDEVAAWTDAQNAYTRSLLDNLPGRQKLEERLRPLMEVGSISAPTMKEGRYFYSQREGTQNQPLVYMRQGSKGKPRLLLDPATIDPSGLVTIAWYAPSHDGKLLAYGTYRAGDENSTLHLLDVDSGQVLPLEIPGKTQGADWLADASGFLYRNLADVKNPYSGQVMFHRMGDDVANDRLVFRQYTEEECAKAGLDPKLATTYGPEGGLSKDGRWVTLAYATDTRNNDLWIADFQDYLRSGKLEGGAITQGLKAESGGPVIGDTMYLQTTLDAPRGCVYAVDLWRLDRKDWRLLVPERQDAVIQGVSVAKDVLAVTYLRNASTSIELYDLNGKSKGELTLPGIGSASLRTEQDSYEAYLSFSSYNYPPSIFRVDLQHPSRKPQLWESPKVPVDPSTIVVKQETYTSKDGIPVTMFIVHKKDLKLDGSNPAILYGYGGFSVSMTPTFSATLYPWLEDGGVYAVANLRGGGEYGDGWHEAGKLQYKQNVFNDMIAAGEYLVQQNYTNPGRLCAMGGSNGGLLTGAMITQRPDLFACVVCQVPLLDMLRFDHFLMAKYWVPEYGSATDAKQFRFLRRYSPYHNIKEGAKYPGILFTAGENDSRVHPLHARKMAAAMQATVAGQSDARPVVLWVDREAGHGQGKPLNLRIRDAADTRMFIMWQLGLLPIAPNELPGEAAAQATPALAPAIEAIAAPVPTPAPAGEVTPSVPQPTPGAEPVAATPVVVEGVPLILLHVEGMKCELCVGAVRAALMGVAGVKDVEVDLKGKIATVTLDGANPATLDALLAALKETEYTASEAK